MYFLEQSGPAAWWSFSPETNINALNLIDFGVLSYFSRAFQECESTASHLSPNLGYWRSIYKIRSYLEQAVQSSKPMTFPWLPETENNMMFSASWNIPFFFCKCKRNSHCRNIVEISAFSGQNHCTHYNWDMLNAFIIIKVGKNF